MFDKYIPDELKQEFSICPIAVLNRLHRNGNNDNAKVLVYQVLDSKDYKPEIAAQSAEFYMSKNNWGEAENLVDNYV